MGTENLKYSINSGVLYQIIGPGHYRPCGGVDFSNIPSVSIVTDELSGSGGRCIQTG